MSKTKSKPEKTRPGNGSFFYKKQRVGIKKLADRKPKVSRAHIVRLAVDEFLLNNAGV
jgi:hypothetical protein